MPWPTPQGGTGTGERPRWDGRPSHPRSSGRGRTVRVVPPPRGTGRGNREGGHRAAPTRKGPRTVPWAGNSGVTHPRRCYREHRGPGLQPATRRTVVGRMLGTDGGTPASTSASKPTKTGGKYGRVGTRRSRPRNGRRAYRTSSTAARPLDLKAARHGSRVLHPSETGRAAPKGGPAHSLPGVCGESNELAARAGPGLQGERPGHSAVRFRQPVIYQMRYYLVTRKPTRSAR